MTWNLLNNKLDNVSSIMRIKIFFVLTIYLLNIYFVKCNEITHINLDSIVNIVIDDLIQKEECVNSKGAVLFIKSCPFDSIKMRVQVSLINDDQFFSINSLLNSNIMYFNDYRIKNGKLFLWNNFTDDFTDNIENINRIIQYYPFDFTDKHTVFTSSIIYIFHLDGDYSFELFR